MAVLVVPVMRLDTHYPGGSASPNLHKYQLTGIRNNDLGDFGKTSVTCGACFHNREYMYYRVIGRQGAFSSSHSMFC